ncbi:MAG: magnesium/cobalt transporter CorA [Deltaproteobacteria bacterium]|nr:magnesium/cobalt transporter CorA [Deltaproteobacteria bacterium]
MAKLVKKRSKKTGLPPGTLVHIGEEKPDRIRVFVVEYDEGRLQEKEIEDFESCYNFPPAPTVTWVDVDGVHEAPTLEKLGRCFGLHPLVLEDILNTDQRPKLEDSGEEMFIVLKALSYPESKGEVAAEQVSLILRENHLIVFQEKSGPLFNPVLDRLRAGKSRIREMGTDYLAYALLDLIVDHYFSVLERMGERIESVEEKVVNDSAPSTLREIHSLKREMILLRKWIWPVREVIGGLEHRESRLIREATAVYLRDLYDHTIQVIETIETFREMLSGLVDIYLSSMNNRLNAVMKVLAIIATIFMPLTFIAGVYGMNFKYMPELEWRWGYPAILLLMTLISLWMLWAFRRKNWL